MVCGVACTVLVGVSAGGAAVGSTWLTVGLWGSGLLAVLCAFVACRLEDDPADDSRYLGSLATGLRSEWQRGSRTS